jgi:purine-binding chemotaxis protein CheW
LASIEEPTDLPAVPGVELGAESAGDEARYLVARASGQRVAIPLLATREVLTVRGVTRLPGAPSFIAGLVNVRGTVLTVLDLAVRLGGAPAVGVVVVVEVAERRLGLRVDAVDGVMRAAAGEEAVEEARTAQGAVRGLVALPDGAALVVDVAALQRAALADA